MLARVRLLPFRRGRSVGLSVPRGAAMMRRILVAVFVPVLIGLTAAPSLAIVDGDPNDVEGPLDFRRLGTGVTSNPDDIWIKVVFYDGFVRNALAVRDTDHGVRLRLSRAGNLEGFFLRRSHGRIVFFYGDLASSCGAEPFPRFCASARVTRPSENVLRVRIPGEGVRCIRAFSMFNSNGETIEDRTGCLRPV